MLLTLEWKNNMLLLIDQTKLPTKLTYVKCKNYLDVADAIKKLVVRGAPAIGVTAAFGLALAAINSTTQDLKQFLKELNNAYKIILSTRPTAVNIQWGLNRIMQKIQNMTNVPLMKQIILKEAILMAEEDIATNKSMGINGANLFSDGDTIMTHCNAGSLATVAYGTALGVIRAAKESGKKITVIATETRPIMQGSRLTAFELQHDNIDVSLIPDTAVGYIMAKGIVKHVVVGADRILYTGHVFNKIGTYQLAILAKTHNIPFYVAAPSSTFDLKNNPTNIIIEERSKEEVIKIGKRVVAPKNIDVINPAFDMTPPELITKIITEKGIISPPYSQTIKKLMQ
ncbi:MAG TPA: S-methyl-5-thioribose-1-phosphate isomerase [Nitrososphaeraceae archaeon]|jgi:methylthioribose-1-phosphate isomerase|nr:S-methyl-5-thioribose-1-phosphate isomerase [Nitrososphaeraceae archaeon]